MPTQPLKFVTESCFLVNKNANRCSDALGGQEDVDDAAIAEERDGPQEEEDDTEEISDEGVLGWESTPVGMNHALQVLRKVVQM